MAHLKNKTIISLGALALTMAAGTSAMAAAISTFVDSPAVPGDPDGTCSLCLAGTNGNSAGDEAEVSIYFEDDGQDFQGDYELSLRLDSAQWRYATIESVSQDDQQTKRFMVDEGSDWDWNDVVEVRVEAVPD